METPGGWKDFISQNPGFFEALQPPPAAVKPARARVAPPPRSTKLSYKDARRLEELEKLMPKLHAGIEAAEQVLADAGLYQRDPSAFARATEALQATRLRLAEAEDEWLRLEELREETAKLV